MTRWLIAFVFVMLGWAARADAAITVSGNGHDFFDVHVGVPVTVNKQLAVPGPGAETYNSITFVATPASGTLAADCMAFTALPASQSVTFGGGELISFTFTPTQRKAISCDGTLRMAGAAVGTFTLSGTGVAPTATVVTTPVDFGTLRVANATVLTSQRNAQIRNNGTVPLSITGVTLTGADYAFVTAPTFPISVAAGATHNFAITFDPSVSGTRTGSLVVASQDPEPGSAAIPNATVNLTGFGGNARINATIQTPFPIAPNGAQTQGIVRVINDAPTNKIGLNLGVGTITPMTLGSTWFSWATNAPFNCTAGSQTCNFTQAITNGQFDARVLCNPNPSTASETQMATISFASDTDPTGAVSSVVMSCTAGRSDIDVSVTSLAFGDQRVGTGSTAMSFTITNTGNIVGTYSIVKTGDGGEFLISNCPSSGNVPATNGVVTCNVVFQPTSAGNKSATFTITTNDPDLGDGSQIISPVTGTGVIPQISGPASVDFGDVDLTFSTATQTITITNTGSQALSITTAVVQVNPSVYTVMTGMTGAQSVPVGGMAQWQLVCTPALQGANAGQFRIVSDSATSSTLNIALACNGVRGNFFANPPSVDFGPVPQNVLATVNVNVSNTGNRALTGISGAIIQTAGQGYNFTTATLPASLMPNGAQVASVALTFQPPDGLAGGPAIFRITGTWTGASAHTVMFDIPLNGDGLSEGVDVSPMAVDFGTFRWNDPQLRPVCVVNNSQFAVTILDTMVVTTMGMAGEITVEPIARVHPNTNCTGAGVAVNNFPITDAIVQANQSLTITLRATPMARVGMLAANVTVVTNLAMNPTRMVTASGIATSGEFTMSPAMVDFGPVDVDTGPVSSVVMLTNSGAAEIDLAGFTIVGADPQITVVETGLPGLPTGTRVLVPGASVSLTVTYDPDVVGPDQISVTNSLAHILNGPTSATLMIQGRGIDRVFNASPPTVTFPSTFKNPGSQAPRQTVTVSNTGEAVLHVTASMLTGDSTFTIVSPTTFDVPGNGSVGVEVEFRPTMAAMSTAQLLITNDDDMTPMGIINIDGLGLLRSINVDPMGVIDLGYTAVGIPATVSGFRIVSGDATNAYKIRAIELSNPDGPFTIVDAPAGTQDPATVDMGIDLAPSSERPFDVTFTAETEGFFETTATIYLDEDPEPSGMVTLRGTAVIADLRGGGGCSTSGGGTGILVAGALAAMLARRRRRAAVAAALLAPSIAAADGEPGNLDVGVFNPTPTTISGTWNVLTADVGKDGDWVASGFVSYATKPLVANFSQLGTANLIKTRTMYELGGAYAFLNRFEAGVRMPLYTQNGDTATMDPVLGIAGTEAKGTARGDLVVHGKVRLVDANLISLGVAVAVTLPTATDNQYTGVDLPTVRALALATFVPHKRLTITVNAGGVVRESAEAALVTQGSGLAYGGAITFRALDKLWLAAELFGEMVPSGQTQMAIGGGMVTKSALSPIEGLLGLTYRVERRTTVGLAVGRGMSDAIGSPELRGVFSLTFAPGTPELKPIHPPPPPKIDGDPDGDGIKDSLDQCDSEPEDVDQFEDTDGCPDPDNDKDGIADGADKCPIDAEDKDSFQDTDGCPDKDNDNDGIADAVDKCPDKAEDKDGFQDVDGCPDLDNDSDGIPDDKDKCVDKPETINGISDDDGCPDKGDSVVVVSPDRIETLEAIQFAANTAKITKASFNVLGQVAATLRAHPEIIRIRVTTHVQPTTSTTKDQDLTDKRAAAVREWLIQWGIASSRIDARGFGGTKTLVPPKNAGSAGVNERLELIILERK